MDDVSDYELQKTDPPAQYSPSKPPSLVPWIAAAVVLAGAAWLYVYRPWKDATAEPSEAVTQTEVPVAEAERPLGVEIEPVDLPPLDETDALVRDLVRALSSHPRVLAWLTTDGLIRNFAVSVENIANGQSPALHQRVLRPQAPFGVVEGRGGLTIDTRAYRRYDDLAAAVDSVDTQGAAKLYSLLKPRIQEAYQELGYTTPFDRALETAMVRLLEAPVVEGDIALIPRGGLYQYNDQRLEQLNGAQKQLLRMGPRNERIVQRKLRSIGRALMIPEERLPRVAR